MWNEPLLDVECPVLDMQCVSCQIWNRSPARCEMNRLLNMEWASYQMWNRPPTGFQIWNGAPAGTKREQENAGLPHRHNRPPPRGSKADNPETLLCDVSTSSSHPVVPPQWRPQAFKMVHNLAHLSIKASVHTVVEHFVRHGLKKQVAQMARNCTPCQTSKVQHHVKAPVQQFEPPAKRFEQTHIDIAGPYQGCPLLIDYDRLHDEVAGSHPTKRHFCRVLRQNSACPLDRQVRHPSTHDK
ncbi:uncharacterized protein [Narcine bancroftii]|uniref:uncharacterized protein n=1 Tax=Narcine bancroftii TaxID=1343680 RepID=UPI0038310475